MSHLGITTKQIEKLEFLYTMGENVCDTTIMESSLCAPQTINNGRTAT